MTPRNRYPGTKPFTAEQKELFYGRKQETDDLMKLIRFQQMVVLYGKSGLGKSSLLNASIKNQAETRKIAEVFSIRFNASSEGEDAPLRKTFAALAPAQATVLTPIADHTLWFAMKARQMASGQKSFLLVFDQFEELFTYPDAAVEAFKEGLTELTRSGLPQRVEGAVKNLALSEADLDALYETMDVKVLFAIRSDRMHLLDQLSDALPDILRHCYELKALVETDAREAIVQPAAMEGDFQSPRFSYTPDALNDVIGFLKDEDGRVEAIQLQTLCQAFETRVRQTGGVSVTADDTPVAKLKAIIDDYYTTQLGDPQILDQPTAHRLIEDELVIETGDGKGVRVTLHELSILAKFARPGASEATEKGRLKKLLEALVNVHLLRRETGARGGDTYELSHDRLIESALKSKKVYIVETRRRQKEAEEAQRESELTEAKNQAELERNRNERLQKALGEAEEQTRVANETRIIAENLLKELRETSDKAVELLLNEIDRNILLLEYESTFEKCQIAAGLKSEKYKQAVKERILETAFWFTEIEAHELAIKMLQILGVGSLPNRADLLTVLQNNSTPEFYSFLQERYYPKLIDVEGGVFKMGTPNGKKDKLLHQVKLSSFQIAETQTTVWQYLLYLKANSLLLDDAPPWGLLGDHPIMNVNWYEGVEYSNWLSARKGKNDIYYGIDKTIEDPNNISSHDPLKWTISVNSSKGFRLPTEAEWEFAARGGALSRGYEYSGSNNINAVAWYSKNSKNRTNPVRQKQPNELGLFDMSGNVWEWCYDWYKVYDVEPDSSADSDTVGNNNIAVSGAVINPTGAVMGAERVDRGGSWRHAAERCRVSTRDDSYPTYRDYYLGFRVASSL